MIIDLCSGARGWEAASDMDAVGFELDRDACLTSQAAGYATVRCDLFDYPIPTGRVEGVIASPPCQPFSRAGKREGISVLVDVVRFIDTLAETGWREPEADWRRDPRIGLVVEPLRWALSKVPEWCAWEQVPDVLPVWEACARVLRAQGWSVWTGCLSAEQYGVPQTRERAFLIASRSRTVQPPAPTHQAYRSGEPALTMETIDLFGDTILPWVSMADALGWGFHNRPWFVQSAKPNSSGGGGSTTREVIRAAIANGSFRLHTNRDQRDDGSRQTRDTTAPAPAFSAKAGGQWCFERPATTVAADPRISPPAHHDDGSQGKDAIPVQEIAPWAYDRPATTVVGSFCPDVIAGPGYRGPGDGPRQNAPGSVKITLEDALVLQSFPADWPLQGTKTSKFRQVGNAVPPLLARAVLEAARA